MAKFTDAIRDTLIGYYNAGDQPTEAQFTDLITRIQEGIEEHNHDATGDGDGMKLDWDEIWTDGVHTHGSAAEGGINLGPLDSITMADDAWIGIGAALERIVFDAAGDIAVMGASLGVGTLTPAFKFDVYENRSGQWSAYFFNDGDSVDRYGIGVQGGADVPATVGTTYYFGALDGSATLTGCLKTVDGTFQLADMSDERRKTNIKNTRLKGLEIINKLKVRDFNWKANPDGPVMTSFVAQEARKIFPAMVGEMGDDLLSTSKAMLIPILTKAIQELDARLTKGGM